VSRRPDPAVEIRLAAPGEMVACANVWRIALDDYGRRIGRMPLAPPAQSFLDLLGHLRETDPQTFLVAERRGRIVGFASAIRRSRVWFLSMLFVRPDEQGHGLGRALLERVLPDPGAGLILATCTDSAQPISNGLYSRYGIVPRLPVLELVGRPSARGLGTLPPGVRAVPFEALAQPAPAAGANALDAAAGAYGPDVSAQVLPAHDDFDRGGTAPGGTAPGETAPAKAEAGPGRLQTALDELDRELLGYAHPEDHAFLARGDRRGFLYEDTSGSVLGYGYVARSGRVGPIAVRDRALVRPVLGHLFGAVEALGAYAVWVPGANTEAVEGLLEAGLLIEDFPALVAWTEPFADFDRYIPITLALL
jgi:GNAT superfamily N-acetyltransferase